MSRYHLTPSLTEGYAALMETLVAVLDAKAPEKWKILFGAGDNIVRCYYPCSGASGGGFAATALVMVVITRLTTDASKEGTEKFQINVLGTPWGTADIPLIAEAVDQLEGVLDVVYGWVAARDQGFVKPPRPMTTRKKRQSKPKEEGSARLL